MVPDGEPLPTIFGTSGGLPCGAPPGIPHCPPSSLVVTSHCVPGTILKPIQSTQFRAFLRLTPLRSIHTTHTAPPAICGQHRCTIETTRLSTIPPILPSPVLPPSASSLIDALVTSARGRRLRNSRPDPWHTTNLLRPLDSLLWFLRDGSSQQRSEGARCAVCCSYGGQ
jgi:hypothetical protein